MPSLPVARLAATAGAAGTVPVTAQAPAGAVIASTMLPATGPAVAAAADDDAGACSHVMATWPQTSNM
jgi:hypothetical protein